MIEIGRKLQERRKELKLNYEDVSSITKLSIPHLKAIEAGDLDYFKDDLTYVRFYVRSYCKALDVPYENFKDDVMDSVEEYTSTITLKKQERIETVEKNIARNTNQPQGGSSIIRKEVQNLLKENKGPKLAKKDLASIHQNAQKNKRFKKSKLDIPMLSFIVVIAVMLVLVLSVGIGSLFNKDEPKPNDDIPPVVDTTPAPEENLDKPEADKVEVSKVEIKAENPTTYTVSKAKLNDKVKVEIIFADNQCWFDGTFNGVMIKNDRPNKIYGPNETYTVENVAGANDVYQFSFGFFPGTKIKVNGEEIAWDASLASYGNVVTINVNIKGE